MAKMLVTKNVAKKANSETVASILSKEGLSFQIIVKGDYNLFNTDDSEIRVYHDIVKLKKGDKGIAIKAPFFNSEFIDAYKSL